MTRRILLLSVSASCAIGRATLAASALPSRTARLRRSAPRRARLAENRLERSVGRWRRRGRRS
jgi:hypothetical protein